MLPLSFLSFFLIASTSQGAELKSFRLDRGRPGCWDEIRSAAMSESEVDRLSVDCQNLRKDYLECLRLADLNPGDFLKKLSKSLLKAKKAAPPYEAILFSVLSRAIELRPALESRAKVERKLKLAFRYADAALFRMDGKACTEKPEFTHPFYREVCTAQDSILATSLTTLNHAAAKETKQ